MVKLPKALSWVAIEMLPSTGWNQQPVALWQFQRFPPLDFSSQYSDRQRTMQQSSSEAAIPWWTGCLPTHGGCQSHFWSPWLWNNTQSRSTTWIIWGTPESKCWKAGSGFAFPTLKQENTLVLRLSYLFEAVLNDRLQCISYMCIYIMYVYHYSAIYPLVI